MELVLKTSNLHGFVGSNPTLSASKINTKRQIAYFNLKIKIKIILERKVKSMLRQFVETKTYKQPEHSFGYDWCTMSPLGKYNELFKC